MPGARDQEGDLEWIELADFTPGIFNDFFTADRGIATPDGAAQAEGTYGCFAGTGGGLYPLPRALAALTDETLLTHATVIDSVAEGVDRLNIIAGRVVAPIQGVEAPALRVVIAEDDARFYYRFEDAAGSTVLTDWVHREYPMVLGQSPDEDLGEFRDGFRVLSPEFGGDGFPTIEGSALEWGESLTFTGSGISNLPDYAFTVLSSLAPPLFIEAVISSYNIDSQTGTLPDPIGGVFSGLGPKVALMASPDIPNANYGFEAFAAINDLDHVGAVSIGTHFDPDAIPAVGEVGFGLVFEASLSHFTGLWTATIWLAHFEETETPFEGPSLIFDLGVAQTSELDLPLGGFLMRLERSGNTMVGSIDGDPVCIVADYDGVFSPPTPAYELNTYFDDPSRRSVLVAWQPWIETDDTEATAFGSSQVQFLVNETMKVTAASASPWTLPAYHSDFGGDFGTLVGGPVVGPISVDTFDTGFAIVEEGWCGNAMALGHAFVATSPTADLYSDQFSFDAFVQWLASSPAGQGGVILCKDTVTNAPLYAIWIQLNLVGVVIFNTAGAPWLSATIAPGDIPVDVTDMLHYVATFDGADLKFYVGATVEASANISTASGTRQTANNRLAHFEFYGRDAVFDEMSYFRHALSNFRVAVHFAAPCTGAAAFRAMIPVAYQWFDSDQAHTRIRLYKPFTAAEYEGLVDITDFYDPYADADTFDPATQPIRYGHAQFELTRSNHDTPASPGPPHLVVVAGPAYNTQSGDWSLFVVPDPDSTTVDSQQEITDGFISMVVSHQGRVVFIGRIASSGEALTDEQLAISERVGFTEINDVEAIVANLTQIYVEENPTGYGVAAALNTNELFMVKRHGGAVTVRGDLENPTVIRLPGVPSTGRFANIGVHTPFGFMYGSDRGVWLWTGGNTAQLLSAQLSGNFLHWNPSFPDAYIGMHGSFCYIEPWLFCPNGWVFDSRTESWWRLIPPRVLADTPDELPFMFYDKDLDQRLYAFPAQYHTDTAAFAAVYDPEQGGSRWRWTSQPLARTRGRSTKVREVEGLMSGFGTIELTLHGIADQDPVVITLDVDSEDPVAFRESLNLESQDVVVSVYSDAGDEDATAPYLLRARVGYDPGKSTPQQ